MAAGVVWSNIVGHAVCCIQKLIFCKGMHLAACTLSIATCDINKYKSTPIFLVSEFWNTFFEMEKGF